MTRSRSLSFSERARWGECPVCKAPDREACVMMRPSWLLPRDWSWRVVHWDRVDAAPVMVQDGLA